MRNNGIVIMKYCLHPISLLLIVLFIKLTAFQIVIFDNKSFFHILLVEFPLWALTVIILTMIFKKRTWLAVWTYYLFLSILFIVVLYYTRYFSTVPSYYDVKQIYQSNSVGGTVALLGNPFDYLFFLDVLLIIPLIWFFSKKGGSLSFSNARGWAIGFSCFGLMMTIVAFQNPLIDVSYFAKKHGYIQSQIVQAFERSIGKALASNDDLSEQKIEEMKGNSYVPFTEHPSYGLAKNRQVFTIQVESLQEFVINLKINNHEITPNLNSLLEDSAYFDNVYQQIGAGNTSDAEWLMHTSLYPEGMDPTVNLIDGSEIPSLVRTLKKNGYGTATYHADDITYWNRDQLYPSLGFDYVYTNKEIPSEKEIGFGPADEVLFNYVESQLPKQLKKHNLMYSNIITLTNHTPFEMPKNYQTLELPERFYDTYVGNYLQSVHYTDQQIGLFIKHLKQRGLYENSVILIYGDHSGLHGAPVTDNDKKLLKSLLGHEYNMNDRFIVPVLFTAPGIFAGETNSQLGGQIDLMPTLLNLLGIEHETQMIGHNLFQYEKNLLGMRYYLPGGSFISDYAIYTAPSAKLSASIYNRKTMKQLKNVEGLQQKMDRTLLIMQQSDFVRIKEAKKIEDGR
jgi:lipoteichoic acid synthase